MRAMLLATVAVAAVSLAGYAWAADKVGGTTQLVGQANATAEDGTARDLAEGSDIYMNDTIVTGAESGVKIQFADNSSLALGASATVLIDEFVYDPASGTGEQAIVISQGAFRFISGLVPKEEVVIDTPQVTLGIRGTIMSGAVEKTADGFGELTCEKDECVVTYKDTGEQVILVGGQCIDWDRPRQLGEMRGEFCSTGDRYIDAQIGTGGDKDPTDDVLDHLDDLGGPGEPPTGH